MPTRNEMDLPHDFPKDEKALTLCQADIQDRLTAIVHLLHMMEETDPDGQFFACGDFSNAHQQLAFAMKSISHGTQRLKTRMQMRRAQDRHREAGK